MITEIIASFDPSVQNTGIVVVEKVQNNIQLVWHGTVNSQVAHQVLKGFEDYLDYVLIERMPYGTDQTAHNALLSALGDPTGEGPQMYWISPAEWKPIVQQGTVVIPKSSPSYESLKGPHEHDAFAMVLFWLWKTGRVPK